MTLTDFATSMNVCFLLSKNYISPGKSTETGLHNRRQDILEDESISIEL